MNNVTTQTTINHDVTLKYDKYIVAFSGGKDSTACFLQLLRLGVPVEKIELWHHLVDGREASFMDWEVTEDYCRKFAHAFGVPIYFSWKDGGFEREMLRENTATAATYFEEPTEDGIKISSSGGKGPNGTRLKFPQVSPDLSSRWCSAYLKIDVCITAIRNQKRFNGLKTVVVSGERAEESAARAKYKEIEPDKSNITDKRSVDRLRIIKTWSESMVWDIIRDYNVVVHPCYYMGFGRCSCKFCIFGNCNQMSSADAISPKITDKIATYEDRFGITIKRKETIRELISKGTPYAGITPELTRISTDITYTGDIFTAAWVLPLGAFGDTCGPQ